MDTARTQNVALLFPELVRGGVDTARTQNAALLLPELVRGGSRSDRENLQQIFEPFDHPQPLVFGHLFML